MSSRNGKGKAKALERSEWSAWIWDQPTAQYYRTRLRSTGEYAYEYQPRENAQTPRSAGSTGVVAPYVDSTKATDQEYYQSRDYGYRNPEVNSSSVNALADDFSSKAVISDSSTVSSSQPASSAPYTASYNTNASSSNYYGGSSGSSVGTTPSRTYPTTGDGYSASTTSSGGYYQTPQSSYTSGAYGADISSSANPYPSSVVNGDSSQTPGGSSFTGSWQSPPAAAAAQNTSGARTPTNTISGTAGDAEDLDSRFRIHNSKSFKLGYVFKVLWSEPAAETSRSNHTDVTEFTIGVKHGQKVHSSIRRFVIVATGHGHSSCVPIATYNRKGPGKAGINPQDHAYIYMANKPPHKDELLDLPNGPVAVTPRTPRDKLDPNSCINYAKIYNVEHNVKVFFIGHLTENSEKKVLLAVNEAWTRNTSSYD